MEFQILEKVEIPHTLSPVVRCKQSVRRQALVAHLEKVRKSGQNTPGLNNQMRCMQFFCNNKLILTGTNVNNPMEGIPDTAYYSAVNQALDSLGIH